MSPSEIYYGSDGAATRALYKELESLGPVGEVALNLFRACKCSARAKVYRGHGYRDAAYDRKQYSMAQLCDILEKHGRELGIGFGWKIDPEQEFFPWVLYVDIPTGQVSFHTRQRGKGPDYPRDWDGTGKSEKRIIAWTESVLGCCVTHTEEIDAQGVSVKALPRAMQAKLF